MPVSSGLELSPIHNLTQANTHKHTHTHTYLRIQTPLRGNSVRVCEHMASGARNNTDKANQLLFVRFVNNPGVCFCSLSKNTMILQSSLNTVRVAEDSLTQPDSVV